MASNGHGFALVAIPMLLGFPQFADKCKPQFLGAQLPLARGMHFAGLLQHEPASLDHPIGRIQEGLSFIAQPLSHSALPVVQAGAQWSLSHRRLPAEPKPVIANNATDAERLLMPIRRSEKHWPNGGVRVEPGAN